MIRLNVKSAQRLFLTALVVVSMVGSFALTSSPRSAQAQAVAVDPAVRLAQIAGAYGVSPEDLQAILADLQANPGAEGAAAVLDAYGIDSFTLNAFIDDVNNAGLAPALEALGLDLELLDDVSDALDEIAYEDYLEIYGWDEAAFEALLADLADDDPLAFDPSVYGLAVEDMLFLFEILDAIDELDAILEELDFDADVFEDAYDDTIDPEILLAFEYGWTLEDFELLLADLADDLAAAEDLADALWELGIDPDDFVDYCDAFEDDAFFIDALVELAIDLAILDALLAEVEQDEMLFEFDLTEEEFDALLDELLASGDLDLLAELYGIDLDDLDAFFDELDDLDFELLALEIDLAILEAELDAIEEELAILEEELDALEAEEDAAGDDGSGDDGSGDDGSGDDGSGDDGSGDDGSGDDGSGDDGSGDDGSGDDGSGDDGGGEG
jgi:DNA-binding Lrp family transcriptional regulator